MQPFKNVRVLTLGFDRSFMKCILCFPFEYDFNMFDFHQGHKGTAMKQKKIKYLDCIAVALQNKIPFKKQTVGWYKIRLLYDEAC